MRNLILKPWARVCAGIWLAMYASHAVAQTVTTIGGGNSNPPYQGYQNGSTLYDASFNQPLGLAMDPKGTYLFIADCSNNAVRVVNTPGVTTTSTTSTFSNSFYPQVTAGISHPVSVLVDVATNVYVLNRGNGTNGTLLEYNALSIGYPSFVITNASHLTNATAMAMDGWTNLYVTVSNTVLRIKLPNTVTVVGSITNAGACLRGIVVLDNGQLALSDGGTNSGIWLMSMNGSVSHLAGFNGSGDNPDNWPVPASEALFNNLGNIAKAGNGMLLVADQGNNRVKLLNTVSGVVTLFYGVSSNNWGSVAYPGWFDGPSGTETYVDAEARLPFGVVVAPDGSVFVAEDYYEVLRQVTSTGLNPPSPGYTPYFGNPAGIGYDNIDNYLFIADSVNNTVDLLNLNNNKTSVFLNSGNQLQTPLSVLVDASDFIYVLNAGTNASSGFIQKFDINGNSYGTLASGLVRPTAFTLDGFGNFIITGQSNSIFASGPTIGASPYAPVLVTTINTNANVSLQGVALFDDGTIAVSDVGNNVIWSVNPVTKAVSRLTGQLAGPGIAIGTNTFAQLNQPHQLARLGGNQIVAADYGNARLVVVQRTGTVSTNTINSLNASVWFGNHNDPVGTGSAAFVAMIAPSGLAVGASGEIFVSETHYDDIRGINTTLTAPSFDPGVPLPLYPSPTGIAYDGIDNYLFIANGTNNTVDLLNLNDNLTSVFLTSGNNLQNPVSVLVDANDFIYVLNAGTNASSGSIQQFDIDGNSYGTLVSGLGQPTAFTLDGFGNFIITAQSNSIFASGPSIGASPYAPVLVTMINTNANVSLQGVALFDDGTIAVSDAGNDVIWTVNPITKAVTRLTGQINAPGIAIGTNSFAKLNQPRQLARLGGNQLVVADYGNNRLVVVQRTGTVSTNTVNSLNASIWFGNPNDPVGMNSAAFVPMISPYGVAVGAAGEIFVSETHYDDIRGISTSLADPSFDPGVPLPLFPSPSGIAYDALDNYLFVANSANNSVDLLNLNDNVTSTFLNSSNGLQSPVSLTVDSDDFIYVLNAGTNASSGFIEQFDIYGNNYGNLVNGLSQPTAFTLDGYGNFVVAEKTGGILIFGSAGSSNTIVTINTNAVSLQGIALFDDSTIAVSDAGNDVIWSVNPITKAVTRLTGQLDVPGIAVGTNRFAQLNQPHQLARLGGNQIVAADYGNNRLVVVQRNGTTSTNAVNSLNASLWFGNPNDPVNSSSVAFVPMVSPSGLAVGASGQLFVSEVQFNDIRGLNTSLAAPSFDPGVSVPIYGDPDGLALNYGGTILYVSDPANNTVSAVNLVNNQTTVFLDSANGIATPVDVASDNADNVYVLNQGSGSIIKYDKYANCLGTNVTALVMPTAMKIDTFGSNFYVAELTGTIQKFSVSSLNLAASPLNTLAVVNTNVNVQLQGIALLDNGSLVVSDAGNEVLWECLWSGTNFNAPSVFTGIMGSPGTNYGVVGYAKLNKPMKLAEAMGGTLLVTDSGNNRVVEVNDAGTVSGSLTSTNQSIWFGVPIDPVGPSSPNFVAAQDPVGIIIGGGGGTNGGVVYTSEDVYKDVRAYFNTGFNPVIPPPSAPINLIASAGYGAITLTWSSVLGATNYTINHSTDSGGPFLPLVTNSATSYIDYELGGSTNYYEVQAVGGGGTGPDSVVVMAVALIPAPPAPIVGWFDYEWGIVNGVSTLLSTIHPVIQMTLYNDASLAVFPGTNGILTSFTHDGSNPSVAHGSTPPTYVNASYQTQPLLPSYNANNASSVVIKAINVISNSLEDVSSAITVAEFDYQTASPSIIGNNGAQFYVSDITTNSVLWYTLDGSEPSNGPPSIGPVTLDVTNTALLSIVVTNDVDFKVRAFRSGYADSGVAEQLFSSSNFVANMISFGFAYGEASSKFVAAPGQTFVAPVTLSILPGAVMYSLQFNVIATNAGPNPGPALSGGYSFQSMLQKPGPVAGVTVPIPPYMFVGDDQATLPIDPSEVFKYDNTNFVSLLTTNSSLNMISVGWIERDTETNLYPAPSQDLIAMSQAHDDTFLQAGGQIVVGGYSFTVPGNAQSNQTYEILIGRPSATSDGIGTPESSVYIAAPTNNFTGAGAINALKYVTVGQPKYLAGSVYPFGWFNAGDFGSSNLVNADVEQVFQSAIYGYNKPPPGSDFFDAMDSCGYTYVNNGNGYLEENTLAPTQPLFNGNDTTINQIAFGDGTLDVCDVYVTFRRSLDPSLVWFQRYWNNGQRVAQVVPNVASHAAKGKNQQPTQTTSSTNAQVNFVAVDVSGSPGQTLQVPINATVFGSYPLRVLMLNLTVSPLDGSPDLTTPIQFNQTASVLGTPLMTGLVNNDNYSAVWLNSTNSGLTGASTIGTLFITIPANATAKSSYSIHFDHASGSPNGIATFPKQTLTGLVTLSSRTNSYYNDGIPDSWRLRYFGTIYNLLSVSNACPTSDGVNNWAKYVAGVDPTVANDFPRLNSKSTVPSGYVASVQWPTTSGTQYVILRSPSLYNGTWLPVSTNTGTGSSMEFDDSSTGKSMYYRILILPP